MSRPVKRARDGFTLAEVMVGMTLVMLLGLGLYGTGMMVTRITHFNRISVEARALGIQWLEEIASRTIPEIAMQVPFMARTNVLQYGEQVVRRVVVTGHDRALNVVSNLAVSAYLEVQVDAMYTSPLTQARVTNTFATLVN